MLSSPQIALVAGLLGALASGAIGFFVRRHLDARALKEAERRLAYVYLVRVSEIVATDLVSRQLIQLYFRPEFVAKLASPDGSFEPSHHLSAALAEGIAAIKPETLASDPGFLRMRHLSRRLLDSLQEGRLTAEQLSKLPKASIEAVYELESSIQFGAQIVDAWVRFFEKGEKEWLTARGIHEQWRGLVRLSQSATRLRTSLVIYGAASRPEAHELLTRQTHKLFDWAAEDIREKPKLAAAQAAVAKTLEKADGAAA